MTVRRSWLIVRHSEIESDGHFAADGLHCSLTLVVGGQQTIAGLHGIAHKETREFRGMELLAHVGETLLENVGHILSLQLWQVDPVEQLWNVRLIECRGEIHQIPQVLGGLFTEAGVQIGRRGICQAPL